MAYSPESPELKPIENLWHELKFYLESKVKPQNKQELVDGINAFWAMSVTEEKCAKYIDHVLKKVVPVVVEAKVQQRNFKDRFHNSKQNGSFRGRFL